MVVSVLEVWARIDAQLTIMLSDSAEKTTVTNPVAQRCADLAGQLVEAGSTTDIFADAERKQIRSAMADLGCNAPTK
jgi:hypothetical protein